LARAFAASGKAAPGVQPCLDRERGPAELQLDHQLMAMQGAPKAAKPWRCASFPEIHPRLRGHLYTQGSRMCQEKWLQPGSVVGTKAWYECNKGSHHKKHDASMGRGDWCAATITMNGEPGRRPAPTFGKSGDDGPTWVSVDERWLPPQSSVASHTAVPSRCVGVQEAASPLSQTMRSRSLSSLHNSSAKADDLLMELSRNSLSSSRASLHDGLTNMKVTFPPTPAFMRHIIRHLPELGNVDHEDVVHSKS